MTNKQLEIEKAYVAAQRMSNWLYNMAHREFLKTFSAQMREMVDEWDKTKTAIALKTIRKKAA